MKEIFQVVEECDDGSADYFSGVCPICNPYGCYSCLASFFELNVFMVTYISFAELSQAFPMEELLEKTATLVKIANSESSFEYITVLTSYINIYSILSCFIFIYVIIYLIFNKLLSNNKNTLIPTLYQIIGENLFKLSLNLFYSILGKNISIPEFFIKINTIFIFLVLSNIQGMIPYMSTLTSALTNTFYIALALFISILSTLFNKKGFFFFF